MVGSENQMTRVCDFCKKIIPLGENHIEVRFIGVKQMENLFKSTELDFCSLSCLVQFWSDKKVKP